MNETLKTIFERRSVRRYAPVMVEKSLIDQVIEAGRMAPSAMNKQPWCFYVLTDPEDIHSISGQIARATVKDILGKGVKTIIGMIGELIHAPAGFIRFGEGDFVFHRAPVVIFITGPRDNEWASLDIGMCCQNMMLAAKSLGLDTCPVGIGKYVEHTKSYPFLHIPPEEQVLIAIILGYGDERPEVHERRRGNVIYISSNS